MPDAVPAVRKLLSSATLDSLGRTLRLSRGGGDAFRAWGLGGRGGCETEDEAG